MLHLTHESVEEHSPYPPAELVRAYEEIEAGMANRMMQMAEQEQQFRHELLRQQLAESQKINQANIDNHTRQISLFERGQWFGLALGVCLLGLAAFAVHANMANVAITAVLAIVGILIVYVLRRQPESKNQPTEPD